MRIQARLLVFDGRLSMPRACGLGFAFPTVGELGTWGARDVIEDGGLNAFQEGHDGRSRELGEICPIVQSLRWRINLIHPLLMKPFAGNLPYPPHSSVACRNLCGKTLEGCVTSLSPIQLDNSHAVTINVRVA